MSTRRTSRVGLWASLCLGSVAVLLAVGFVLRTRPVLGERVAGTVKRWAERVDADIAIRAMRPVGLTGIRLEDVRVRVHRDGVSAYVRAPAVDVHPSLGAILGGRAEPRAVIVQGGEVELRREQLRKRKAPEQDEQAEQASQTTQTDASPVSVTDSDSSTDADTSPNRRAGPGLSPPKTPKAPPAAELPPLQVTLRDLQLRGEVPGTGLTTRPMTLHRVSVILGREGGLSLREVRGYGSFPGGTAFSAVSGPAVSDPDVAEPGVAETADPSAHRRISISTTGRTRLEDWLDIQPGEAPLAGRLRASITGMHLCPTCPTKRLCLQDLSVQAPRRLHFVTMEGCLEAEGSRLSLTTREIEAYQGDEELPYRIEAVRATSDLRERRAGLTVSMLDRRLGEARLETRLEAGKPGDSAAPTLRATFETERFHPGDLFELARLDGWIRGGSLSGRLETEWTPTLGLVSAKGSVGYRDGTVEHPFLDEEPLRIDSSRLAFEAAVDTTDRSVAVREAKLAMGGIEPLHLWGTAVAADPGWSFEAGVQARSLDAPQLRDVLPDTLALPALGSRMTGDFEGSVYTAGHTAFPDSLQLEVEVDGDVRVLQDSPYADIRSLAVNGLPPLDSSPRPIPAPPMERWASLETLPDYLPRILLAAEDATFYEHPGFSWRGIRNAMAHNLKVDRLERGGSTITQQLAKNLFLTRRRTLARKLQEVWVTWRLEQALGKDRILELYLNLVEWGPGIRGLDEAARHYFGVAAEELTVAQMTLLGAIVPGPSLYGPQIDAGYLPSSRLEKMEHILANLRWLEIIEPETYTEIYEAAKRGKVGGLDLKVCADDRRAPEMAPEC